MKRRWSKRQTILAGFAASVFALAIGIAVIGALGWA